MKKNLHLPIALQQAIYRSLRHHLNLAAPLFDDPLPEPSISWQQRGTTAGSAWLKEWQIRLNPVLCEENQQAFVEQVVPHELAHLLVWKKFGRVAPHGREWRWMMEEILQVKAERTHHFTTTSVAGQTFPYHCECQQHALTLRRHNRVVRGETEYRCRRCAHPLHLGEFKASKTETSDS